VPPLVLRGVVCCPALQLLASLLGLWRAAVGRVWRLAQSAVVAVRQRSW
jgi:hypothetical protein